MNREEAVVWDSLRALPPAPSNVPEAVFLVWELVGVRIMHSQEVVKDTGGLYDVVDILGKEVYGSQEYPPHGRCNAERVLHTAPA